MITINSSDIIKKPSYITRPTDITFVEDAKKHITKSVALPYALYLRLKEKIEDEVYLMNNKEALSKKANDEFLEIEFVSEDLTRIFEISFDVALSTNKEMNK